MYMLGKGPEIGYRHIIYSRSERADNLNIYLIPLILGLREEMGTNFNFSRHNKYQGKGTRRNERKHIFKNFKASKTDWVPSVQ